MSGELLKSDKKDRSPERSLTNKQGTTGRTPRAAPSQPSNDRTKFQPKPEKTDRSRFQRAQGHQKSDVKDSRDSRRNSRDAGLPFLKEDEYTNVVLVVEGKKLYINSSILGYPSPYFDKLFSNGNGKKSEYKIEGKSYSDFVDLLGYLHPSCGKELNGNNFAV